MDSYTDASPSQVEAVSEWSNASRDAGSVSQPHGTKPGPNRVAAELHQRMQDAGLSEPSKLFDSFDPTRSGTISFDDFATTLKFMNVNAPQSEIQQIASRADRYGDGEVHVPTIVAEINRAAVPSDRTRSNKFAGLGRSNSTSGPIFTSHSDISQNARPAAVPTMSQSAYASPLTSVSPFAAITGASVGSDYAAAGEPVARRPDPVNTHLHSNPNTSRPAGLKSGSGSQQQPKRGHSHGQSRGRSTAGRGSPTPEVLDQSHRVLARKLHGRPQRLTAALQKLDADRDGHVTHDEFTRGIRRLGIGLSEQQLKSMISAYDPEGAGSVRIQDIEQVMEGVQGVQKQYKESAALQRMRQQTFRQTQGLTEYLTRSDGDGTGELPAPVLRQRLAELGVTATPDEFDALVKPATSRHHNGQRYVDYMKFANLLESADGYTGTPTTNADASSQAKWGDMPASGPSPSSRRFACSPEPREDPVGMMSGSRGSMRGQAPGNGMGRPTSARDRRNLLSRQKALDSVAHRADALLEGLHVAPTPESARHLNSDPWVRATASPGVDLNVPAGQRTADQELYTQKLIGAVPRTRRSTPQPSARDSSNGGRVVIHGAKSGLGTSRDMDTGSGTPQSSHAPHNSGSSREAKPTASPSQFARSDTGAGASSKQPFVSYKQLADSLNHAVCGLLEGVVLSDRDFKQFVASVDKDATGLIHIADLKAVLGMAEPGSLDHRAAQRGPAPARAHANGHHNSTQSHASEPPLHSSARSTAEEQSLHVSTTPTAPDGQNAGWGHSTADYATPPQQGAQEAVKPPTALQQRASASTHAQEADGGIFHSTAQYQRDRLQGGAVHATTMHLPHQLAADAKAATGPVKRAKGRGKGAKASGVPSSEGPLELEEYTPEHSFRLRYPFGNDNQSVNGDEEGHRHKRHFEDRNPYRDTAGSNETSCRTRNFTGMAKRRGIPMGHPQGNVATGVTVSATGVTDTVQALDTEPPASASKEGRRIIPPPPTALEAAVGVSSQARTAPATATATPSNELQVHTGPLPPNRGDTDGFLTLGPHKSRREGAGPTDALDNTMRARQAEVPRPPSVRQSAIARMGHFKGSGLTYQGTSMDPAPQHAHSTYHQPEARHSAGAISMLAGVTDDASSTHSSLPRTQGRKQHQRSVAELKGAAAADAMVVGSERATTIPFGLSTTPRLQWHSNRSVASHDDSDLYSVSSAGRQSIDHTQRDRRARSAVRSRAQQASRDNVLADGASQWQHEMNLASATPLAARNARPTVDVTPATLDMGRFSGSGQLTARAQQRWSQEQSLLDKPSIGVYPGLGAGTPHNSSVRETESSYKRLRKTAPFATTTPVSSTQPSPRRVRKAVERTPTHNTMANILSPQAAKPPRAPISRNTTPARSTTAASQQSQGQATPPPMIKAPTTTNPQDASNVSGAEKGFRVVRLRGEPPTPPLSRIEQRLAQGIQ